MTQEQQHPLTPPPELVQQWSDIKPMEDAVVQNWVKIATQAAQWGADQELEACVEWLLQKQIFSKDGVYLTNLLAARRPKPLSLKEQALEQLGCIQTDLNKFGMGISTDTIRRALEALND
jgi:hypothetical protein